MHFGTSPSHFPDLVQVNVSFPLRINPSSQKNVACTVPPSFTLFRDTRPCGTCSFAQDIGRDGVGGGSPTFTEHVDKLLFMIVKKHLQSTIRVDYASFVIKCTFVKMSKCL